MPRIAMRLAALLTGLCLCGLWLVAPALAQDASGDWHGTLSVSPGVELPLTLHIKRTAGGVEGTLDNPNRGVLGEPLSDVSAKDGVLTFTGTLQHGTYRGVWDATTHGWKGSLWLAGRDYPLAFTAGEPPPAVAPASPPAWTTPSDADIRALLAQRIDAGYRGIGMVVGVIDSDGRRIVSYGARSAADPRPPDGDSVFEIGSITKSFTGLLLADMIDKGEVSLNDPVAKYLPPDVVMPEHGGKQITLGDLVTNTSGLPDNPGEATPTDSYAGYAASGPQLYALLRQIRLDRDPGVAPSHSNIGVGLLGLALARQAGLSYAALVERRITGPLGMTSTALTPTADMAARRLAGHGPYLAPAPDIRLGDLAGAGALNSTANDMLKLLAAELGFADSPLTRAMAIQLSAVRRPNGPGQEMALEMILLQPSGLVLTNGGTFGFQSFMGFDPKRRVGVIVLANVGQGGPRVTDDIGLHVLAGAKVAALPAPTPPPSSIALAADALARFVGSYQFSPQASLTISRDGDRLFAQLTGQGAYEIFPQSPTDFFYKAVDARLSFIVGQDGKVTGLTLRQNGRAVPATRVP